jgi:ADP-heptose:LPS heptosyltransferase
MAGQVFAPAVVALQRRIELPPGTQERTRYGLILQELHVPTKAGFPWRLPHQVEHDARLHLRNLGLQEGQYIVCFPTGSESTKLKRWPEERFLNVLAGISRERRLPILLTGEIADEPRLSRIADSIRLQGGKAAVFCGRPLDVPLLGGLVAMASAYLGNDTGPMHLASAYGVPGVAIYGGGHWPSYAPWGKGSIGMVQPMPCFECDWDCVFGHGICVEAIDSAAVLTAMRNVLSEPPAKAEFRTPHSMFPATEDLVRDASARYRLVQQDRAARLDLILKQNLTAAVLEEQHRAALAGAEAREVALAAAMTQAQTERRDFEAEAERRLAKLVELTGMVQERDRHIAELEKAGQERLEALERTESARQQFEAEAEQRLAKLLELTGMVQERDRRIAELEKAGQERLEALERTELARQELNTAIADLQIEFARCRQSLVEKLEAEQTSRRAASDELAGAKAALADARACCSKMDAELIALRNEKLINFLIRRYKSHSDVPPRA